MSLYSSRRDKSVLGASVPIGRGAFEYLRYTPCWFGTGRSSQTPGPKGHPRWRPQSPVLQTDRKLARESCCLDEPSLLVRRNDSPHCLRETGAEFLWRGCPAS